MRVRRLNSCQCRIQNTTKTHNKCIDGGVNKQRHAGEERLTQSMIQGGEGGGEGGGVVGGGGGGGGGAPHTLGWSTHLGRDLGSQQVGSV